jgi:hypothetical protein
MTEIIKLRRENKILRESLLRASRVTAGWHVNGVSRYVDRLKGFLGKDLTMDQVDAFEKGREWIDND